MPCLQLDPAAITAHRRNVTTQPVTAEASVAAAVAFFARQRFLQELVSGSWNFERVEALVLATAEEDQAAAFDLSGRGKYVRLEEVPPHPLSCTGRPTWKFHDEVRPEWQELALPDVSFPAPYVAGVQEWLRTRFATFASIDDLIAMYPAATRLLDLTREVWPAVAAMTRGEGIDPVHRFISEAMADRNPIVPPEEAPVLTLLTLLPWEVRCGIQELIVNRCLLDTLRGKVPAPLGQAFMTVENFFELNIQANSHWSQLADAYGTSPELACRLGRLRTLQKSTRAFMQSDSGARPAFRAVGTALEEGRRAIEAGIDEVYEFGASPPEAEKGTTPLTFWQLKDIGHTFAGMGRIVSAMTVDVGNRSQRQEKNGLYAAVLEDDPEQLELWSGIIERDSPYQFDLGGRGRCSHPEDVVRLFDDSRFGLFVLDMDNFGNRTCGLDTALSLVDRHLAEIGRGYNGPARRIVVWSSDRALVNLARDTIHRLLYGDTDDGSQGISSRIYSSLNVTVQSKATELWYR